MTGSFLKNGLLHDFSPEAVGEWNDLQNVQKAVYFLTESGRFRKESEIPALSDGEGMLAIAGTLAVRPLEIQVDFLKAADGEEWLNYLLLRHIDRMKALDSSLYVVAVTEDSREATIQL